MITASCKGGWVGGWEMEETDYILRYTQNYSRISPSDGTVKDTTPIV